jgi:hypothetical protein
MRTANCRGGRVVDHRYSKASGPTVDMQGVMGEFAMCRLLDLNPHAHIDESAQNQCAAADTFDIRLAGGDVTIDVKCVRNDAQYPLLVTAKKYENPASHYCLVSVRNCPDSLTLPEFGPVRVVFEGSATGAQVFNHDNVRLRYANRPMFEVAYENLTSLVLTDTSAQPVSDSARPNHPNQYESTGSSAAAVAAVDFTHSPRSSLLGRCDPE